MMKCPICQSPGHTRSSEYLSEIVKTIYYRCSNLDCSCTFTATEYISKIISRPENGKVVHL